MTRPIPLSDSDMLVPSSPEWTEQRALDEKPPPEPVRVSLGWRILGWIVNIVTAMAGG